MHWTSVLQQPLQLGGHVPPQPSLTKPERQVVSQEGVQHVLVTRHTAGGSQSVLTLHSTQEPSPRHWSSPAPLRCEHSASPVAMGLWVQPRQTRLLPQMGAVAPVQFALVRQATQAPVALQ
jgi:hypothetical protein